MTILRRFTSVIVIAVFFAMAVEANAQIQFLDGSRIVANDGTVSLGSVVQNATAKVKSVTIKNTGKAAVNLGFAATVYQANQSNDFEVVDTYAANQQLQPGATCTVSVRLSNRTTGYKTGTLLIAGQRINLFGTVTTGAIVVDDLDPGFSVTGKWPTQSPGYGGRQLRTPGGGQTTSTATASWRFDGLKPGLYEIGVTWGGGSQALASNAQYVVRDGSPSGTVVATATANQWYVPASQYPVVGGQPFQKLTMVTIKSSTLIVTVSNIGNFSSVDVAADAMLIVPK